MSKIYTTDKKTGTFIDEFKTIEEAMDSIAKYEETDKNVKEIFTIYSSEHDITVIMEDVYIDGEIRSTALKGFYYGSPDEKDTKQYYGKLEANYDMGH